MVGSRVASIRRSAWGRAAVREKAGSVLVFFAIAMPTLKAKSGGASKLSAEGAAIGRSRRPTARLGVNGDPAWVRPAIYFLEEVLNEIQGEANWQGHGLSCGIEPPR